MKKERNNERTNERPEQFDWTPYNYNITYFTHKHNWKQIQDDL